MSSVLSPITVLHEADEAGHTADNQPHSIKSFTVCKETAADS